MPVVCDCGEEVEFEVVGMHRRKVVCPDCGVISDDREIMGEKR